MDEHLHMADFTPWLNHVFAINFSGAGDYPARLTEVKEINSFTTIQRKPFSIVFRTDQKTEYFQQAICILRHPEKGDLPLFLVPIGFDGVGMRYEAIFA